MSQRIQLKRDTAANWTTANTVLRSGEMGLEIDTLKAKFGNGTSGWNSISYAFGGASGGDMLKSENLSGLVNNATARTNIGAAGGTGTANGTNTGDQTSIVGISGTKAQFNTAVTDGDILYVGDVVASSLTAAGIVELATTAEINTGTDTSRAIPIDQFVASNRNVRYIDIYAVEKATDNTVGNNIAGAIECPFTGTITEIGGYVETAGVTGASVWDVNKNGTTIMTTNKLSIDTAEVSTRTAANAPTLTTTTIVAGDLITIDTDSLSTTKPKGFHVRIGIRLT